MSASILLTSFAPWQSHQTSNSSHDLVQITPKFDLPQVRILPYLPVNVPIAAQMTLAKIQALKPSVILCCGMAEHRRKLSVESQAIVNNRTMTTTIDLPPLISGLTMTEISHNAGQFVCNGLYYEVLKFLHHHHSQGQGLFLHVPILTEQNQQAIEADFQVILQRILHQV